MVPKGDYTKQKYIIGRKVDENSDEATYNFNFKLPFDNFVGLENLTYQTEIAEKSYLANHPQHGVSTAEVLTNISSKNLIWSWQRSDDNPVIETKLGIAANWKVLLGKYKIRQGVYGLRVDVTGMTRSVEGENSKVKTTSYYFTNNDMYGNSYAFYEPTQQQVIFDISEYLTLNTITICFYQDHNFVDAYGHKIAYQDPADTDPNKYNLPANISVSGLQVLLGLTTDECTTDRVFLYTYDDMYYGYDPLNNLSEYEQYHAEYTAIQISGASTAEKQRQLNALVERYMNLPGYEWLKPRRELQFAWVHLDEKGNPILVNHYKKNGDNDTGAFEYWVEAENAQLHWYHYEFACPQDGDILAERQGGVNWAYLETTAPVYNIDSDDITSDSYNKYIVTPDATKARDQWKAIVSVNNIPYTTEPLIFTNVDTSVETAAFETLNEITLRFLREEEIYNEETDTTTINIVEDNTLRDFYVYDENNRVLKDNTNVSYAEHWYYVQIWLRNNDNGEYLPLTYDPEQGEVSVYWNFDALENDGVTFVPPNSSMIAAWAKPTAEELRNAVLAPVLEGASTLYNNQILKITRKFKIRDYWDLAYLNNTISAVVQRRVKTYHPQMELHFGQAGSMGSEYTISIQQIEPEGQYLIPGREFQLAANVIKKGQTVTETSNSKFIFAWRCLSPSIITTSAEAGLYDNNTGKYRCEWIVENGAYFNGNVIRGFLQADPSSTNPLYHEAMPPIFEVTVTNAADYPISAVVGFRVINDVEAASIYTTNCPTRVEFKSDGTVPLALMNTFSVYAFENGAQTEIYPPWNLQQYYKNLNGTYVAKNDYLNLTEEVTYDQMIATNQNPLIYYQPSGNNINLDSIFTNYATATNTACTSYVNIENAIQKAYDDTLANLSGNEGNVLTISQQAQTTKDRREKNLALAATKVIPGYTRYKLNPYIQNTTNEVSWYWENSMKNYYTVLGWIYNDTGKTITVYQALPFARNVYSSSLLNSWDGSLTIDEQENLVMAQMISAGMKNSNNTFTGVILGNWAERGDSSLDTPGLYGLENGAQVFGFRTNGTGFIGKSGRGQIQFDGNHSLISNVDKTMYLNLDPRTFDYTNGNLNINDYYGYSPYFLYAETVKSSTASLVGEDSLEESTTWVNKFMNDAGKDYFIVDPNNGILTTGGVIARYGKIGNWLISSAGLYQKYTGSTTTTSRYMYLGYPSAALDNIQTIQNNYDLKKIRIIAEKDTALNKLYNDYRNNMIEFLGRYYKQIYDSDPMHFYNYGWTAQAAYLAAEATIAAYDADSSISLKSVFETNYSYYVDHDARTRYHTHYQHGYPSTYGNQTGWTPAQWVYNAQIRSCGCNTSNGQLSAPFNSAGGQYQITGYSSDTTEPTMSLGPTAYQVNTYWGSTSSNVQCAGDPDWLWVNKYREYGATDTNISVLNTNTLTIAKLRTAAIQFKAWYDYQTAAYNKQLDEMLAAGMAYLKQLPEYAAYKRELDAREKTYLETRKQLIADYNKLINNLATKKLKTIDDLLIDDKNKYAIFAGYTPTSIPLFSVNWRGYMTVRAGKIGEKSPWYISDEGLTQKNNSGTIFLGNPESRSDGTGWTDLGLSADMGNLTNILLPNDKTNTYGKRGPQVLGASDDTSATYGNFAIYAGNQGKVWKYDNTTHKYTRENETSASIKFGVRMDGTLYAQVGRIGGWYFNNQMIYSYPTDPTSTALEANQENLVVLDSARGVISLGNAVVLSADGEIVIGAYNPSTGETTGSIYIAGFQFLGKTNKNISYNLPNYTTINGTTSTLISTNDNISYWGGKIQYTTTQITPKKSQNGTTAKEITVEGTLEIKNRTTSSSSLILAAGKDENNKALIALYPSHDNSVLGTTDNRWDIISDTIVCNTLDITKGNINAKRMFMENELVATETWVKDQLVDVYNAIKSTGGGSSGVGSRSYGGTSGVAGALNKGMNNLVETLKEPVFVTDITIKDGEMKFTDWQLTGSWTDFTVDNTTGSSGTDGGGELDVSWTTTKDRTFIFDATTIPLVSGGGDKIAKYLINGWDTTTVDANGKVTLKLKRADGEGTYDTDFNQADTAFFKRHALGTWSIGEQTVQTRTVATAAGVTLNKSVPDSKVTYSTANKKEVVIAYELGSLGGPTFLTKGNITVDVTKPYDQGYLDGWNAAVNKITTISGGTDSDGRSITYVVTPDTSDGTSYGTKNKYKYAKSTHSISTGSVTSYSVSGPVFASSTYVFYGYSSDPASAYESTHSRKGDLYTVSNNGSVTTLTSHDYKESSFGSA